MTLYKNGYKVGLPGPRLELFNCLLGTDATDFGCWYVIGTFVVKDHQGNVPKNSLPRK